MVARAWADPAYRARLRADATAAIAELGFGGRQGEHMVVVENTPRAQPRRLHAVLLLSVAGARPAAGLVQVARPTGRAPSSIRAACWPISASTLPAGTRIRVWDSTAELRYLVIPMRPAGTEGWSEEALAELVTRDSMIGTGLALAPAAERA